MTPEDQQENFECNLSILQSYHLLHIDEIRKSNPELCNSDETANEAEQTFESIENKEELTAIVVFGIGKGYVFETAQSWLDDSDERFLIFCEDQFPCIHRLLTTPRGTKLLSHPRCLLIPFRSPKESSHEFLTYDFEFVSRIIVKKNIFFSVNPRYRLEREDLFIKIKNHIQIRTHQLRFLFSVKDIKYIAPFTKNIYANLFHEKESLSSLSLHDAMKEIPVIICGAGPSLQDQLEELNSLMDKALIIASGTAMNVLNGSGIFPHIGVGIDPNRESYNRVKTNFAFETLYFFAPSFHSKALHSLHGPKVLFETQNMFRIQNWFHESMYQEKLPSLHSGISTTISCLGIAEYLGANPVILIGLDLSYSEGKRYPKGTRIDHPLERERSHISSDQMITERKITTQGIDGEPLETRSDWLEEASLYTQYANSHPEVKLINSTSKGVKIPLIPSLPIHKVINQFFTKSYDLINRLHAEVYDCQKQELCSKKLDEAIEAWRNSLKVCIDHYERIIDLLSDKKKKYEEDDLEIPVACNAFISHQKKIGEEPVYKNLCSQLNHILEIDFTEKVYLTRRLSDELSKKESLLLEVEIETERATFFYELLQLQQLYLEKAVEKNKIRKNKQDDDIKEKSCDPELSEEAYSYSEDILSIKDPELNLDLHESFIPTETRRIYDGEGGLKGIWYYKEDVLHGPSRFYNKVGQLLAEGWFWNNRRVGKNWQYYPSGKLYSLQRFSEGVPDGLQEYYYENGMKKSVITFSKGQLDGVTTLYYKNGRKKRENYFSQGRLHGFERMWAENGQLILEIEYRDNIPLGTARTWYESGDKKTELIIYDKPENYDVYHWDRDGNLMSKEIYLPKTVGKDANNRFSNLKEQVADLTSLLRKLKDKKSP